MATVSKRYELLRHYKLAHGHFGQRHPYPCTYFECPCSFKTWNALKTHLSKSHVSPKSAEVEIYTCSLCPGSAIPSNREYFAHIYNHLKRFETVTCMYQNCSYQSNIYASFKSHKSRKHSTCTVNDLKVGVVTNGNVHEDNSPEECCPDDPETGSDLDSQELIEADKNENLEDAVIHKLASVLLKLEINSHVPTSAIDVLLEDLHFIFTSAVVPVTNSIAVDVFKKHELNVDQLIIDELSIAISTHNPLLKAIAKDGSLATGFKRQKYYKEHFKVVEPVEYVLDARAKKTYQYVPILKSLQQLLEHKDIADKVVHSHAACNVNQQLYCSFQNGEHYKNNLFLSGKDLRISLCLYVDDFELCNPLGTSRKKHKLCAIYWVLGNLPHGSNSALSSIYLALLCKSSHVREFGYEKILEPLLHDLVTLEQHGLFIPQLGSFIKGTVQCVTADNLGAHGLGGFVESFSGKYYCRFCTAEDSEIQGKEVRSEAFQRRTKDAHQSHVTKAQERGESYFAVKRPCVLTQCLSHFNVISGYPPDIVHDLFEGIVPLELALCIAVFLSKKFFTLDRINHLITSFPYKFGDKTNRPHLLPKTLLQKKLKSQTIGGNAHENWCLLRLLPLMVGTLVPDNEPAWQLILDLHDIVELVVAPIHCAESIDYLEFKISEHRQRFKEVFPDKKLLPKHHFLEHYPEMIKNFGPLVALWTMRYEAKHSFFKQIVRHTKNFRNITLSLAKKHQLMVGYHLNIPESEQSPLKVAQVSKVPIDVLNEDVVHILTLKYPEVTAVNLANSVSINGIEYKKGMIVVHGSCGGLPEFSEIIQLCILKGALSLIVKKFSAWYWEHFRAYELEPTRLVALVGWKDLADHYPLADYKVGSKRMVTLKRFLYFRGKMNNLNNCVNEHDCTLCSRRNRFHVVTGHFLVTFLVRNLMLWCSLTFPVAMVS